VACTFLPRPSEISRRKTHLHGRGAQLLPRGARGRGDGVHGAGARVASVPLERRSRNAEPGGPGRSPRFQGNKDGASVNYRKLRAGTRRRLAGGYLFYQSVRRVIPAH